MKIFVLFLQKIIFFQIARIVPIIDRATAAGNPGLDFKSSILLKMGDFLRAVLIPLEFLLV